MIILHRTCVGWLLFRFILSLRNSLKYHGKSFFVQLFEFEMNWIIHHSIACISNIFQKDVNTVNVHLKNLPYNSIWIISWSTKILCKEMINWMYWSNICALYRMKSDSCWDHKKIVHFDSLKNCNTLASVRYLVTCSKN